MKFRYLFLCLILFLPAVGNADILDFYLRISPNSQGFLEGSAGVDINWWTYLQSGTSYRSESLSYSEETDFLGHTLTVKKKTTTLNLLGTRDGILNALLGINFLDINGKLLGRVVNIDRYDYGATVSTNSAIYFYQEYQHIYYLKPLIGFNATLHLGPIDIGGFGEWSPRSINESMTGYFADSVSNTLINYFTDTEGFELLLGGTFLLIIPDILQVGFDYSWFRQIGYAQGVQGGTAIQDYVYYVYDIGYSFYVFLDFLEDKLEFLDQTPMLGFTYIQHRFEPLPEFGITGFTEDRFTIDFGLEL